MLHNINWTQYFIALIILLTIYYGYVLKRFYFADIIILFKGKQPTVPTIFMGAQETDSSQAFAGEEKTDTDDTLEQIEALTGRVKMEIVKAANNRTDYPSTITALKSILNEYPKIKDSEFRPAINELILAECEKTGFIILNEEDVDDLWGV